MPELVIPNSPSKRWFSLFSGTLDSEIEMPMLSGSMAPLIVPGDTITIRPLHGKNPHRGDIVAFRKDGAMVAHRLIFVLYCLSGAILVEKGDANRVATFVKKENLRGTVVRVRRNGETVMALSPRTRSLARKISSKMLVSYLAVWLPLNFLKRMVRRNA